MFLSRGLFLGILASHHWHPSVSEDNGICAKRLISDWFAVPAVTAQSDVLLTGSVAVLTGVHVNETYLKLKFDWDSITWQKEAGDHMRKHSTCTRSFFKDRGCVKWITGWNKQLLPSNGRGNGRACDLLCLLLSCDRISIKLQLKASLI